MSTATNEPRTAGPRTIVLKVGGANLERPEYVAGLARYAADLQRAGARIVLVHGGGREIGALHDALDVPFRKIDGLRVTSETSLGLTIQMLCGLINKRLVVALQAAGADALGLSGVDLGLLRADLLDEKRLGRVGVVSDVRSDLLDSLLDAGFLLVVAPVSLGLDGCPLNVNADDAAFALAKALGADDLDFVSDVPGVRVEAGSDRVAPRLEVERVQELVRDTDVIQGGMRPKLSAAAEAVEGGVSRVRIGTLSSIRRGRATEIVA